MVELDVFFVDVPSHERALIGLCFPESLAADDVKKAAKERISWALNNEPGVMHTSPILLKETNKDLIYGVIWKRVGCNETNYDLYAVEVIYDDARDAAVTAPIELPYRNTSMVGTLLNMMPPPTFHEQRASRRVRAILRGEG